MPANLCLVNISFCFLFLKNHRNQSQMRKSHALSEPKNKRDGCAKKANWPHQILIWPERLKLTGAEMTWADLNLIGAEQTWADPNMTCADLLTWIWPDGFTWCDIASLRFRYNIENRYSFGIHDNKSELRTVIIPSLWYYKFCGLGLLKKIMNLKFFFCYQADIFWSRIHSFFFSFELVYGE